MKKLFFLLLIICFIGSSCCKSDLTDNNAKLIGIDFRKCASPFCGGWFIEIEGDTLRFIETPEKTDIDLNGQLIFPIPVKVKGKKYDNEWKDVEDLIFVEELWRG